jgi:hypothetical protein
VTGTTEITARLRSGEDRNPSGPLPADASNVRTAVGRETGRAWLRGAMAALAVLAAGAAVVSWDAQYVMVYSARHAPAVAALEAGIPDAGALIFAALGIALALHGRRALRPRALNVACVAISLAMNAMAAGRGWRDMAIWVMPAERGRPPAGRTARRPRRWARPGPGRAGRQCWRVRLYSRAVPRRGCQVPVRSRARRHPCRAVEMAPARRHPILLSRASPQPAMSGRTKLSRQVPASRRRFGSRPAITEIAA